MGFGVNIQPIKIKIELVTKQIFYIVNKKDMPAD